MGEIDAGRLAANSAMTRARAYVECVEHSICRVHECLYDASGNVLAVVEAKRCSRHAREADEQLRHYVTEISKKQPFAPFRIHGQRP